MDPTWTQVAEAAATAIAGSMATDAWSTVRRSVSRLLAGGDSDREGTITAWLDDARKALGTQPGGGRSAVAHAVEQQIGQVLLDRLAADAGAAGELARLLTRLGAAPTASNVRQQARASGHGRVYQAGGDIRVSERPAPT